MTDKERIKELEGLLANAMDLLDQMQQTHEREQEELASAIEEMSNRIFDDINRLVV